MKWLYLSLSILCFHTVAIKAQPIAHVALPPQIWLNHLFSGGVGIITNYNLTGFDEQVAWIESQDTTGIYPKDGLMFSTGIADKPISQYGFEFGTSIFDADIFSLSGIPEANDPVILTIEFIAATDSINFDFAFASNEFPMYSCSQFNDVAGVFLSGPGINGSLNVSEIIPGNYPLGVESIFCHNAYPYLPFNQFDFYNGISAPIMKRSVAIQPCETYTLKIIIADIEDGKFDSALLAGKIMPSNTNIIRVDAESRVFIEGCASKPVFMEFEPLSNVGTIQYMIDGTATLGEDYWLSIPPTGVVSNNSFTFFPIILNDTIMDEFETIDVHFDGPDCTSSFFRFFITDLLPSDTTICHDDTIPAFRLPSPVDFTYESNEAPDYYNSRTVTIPLNVNGVPFDNLYNPAMIKEVCVEYSGLNDYFPSIYLLSPSNTSIKLTTQTVLPYTGKICFTPDAVDSISTINLNAGPDYGNFKPEGNWAELGGSINGIWALVWTRESNFPLLTDLKWNITFTKEFLLDEFQYEWSNGTTDLGIPVTTDSVQAYSVHFFNDLNDCERIIEITPAIDFTEVSQPVCEGGSYIFNDVLFNAANPSGMFEFENTDGCDSIVEFNLIFHETTTTTVSDTICADEKLIIGEFIFDIDNPTGAVTLHNSSTGCDSVVLVDLHFFEPHTDTLNMAINAGEFVIVGLDTFSQSGEYVTYLEDSHGCDSTVVLYLSVLTAANEHLSEHLVSIFPNPVADELTIQPIGEIEIFEIMIYNSIGQHLYKSEDKPLEKMISVKDFPNGIVFILVKTSFGLLIEKVIIAQ